MEELLAFYLSLGGVAALIAVLINVLKKFGVVKDGTAPTWSLGFNLVGLVATFALNVFAPEFDFVGASEIAQTLAEIGALILGLVGQLAISRGTNAAVRGTPLLGYSNSK